MKEEFICDSCAHYKDYKCGEKNGKDNMVKMCELEECCYEGEAEDERKADE